MEQRGPGSIRSHVQLELQKVRNIILLPAPEKEKNGREEPGLLDP
jgi:hypothetical protein